MFVQTEYLFKIHPYHAIYMHKHLISYVYHNIWLYFRTFINELHALYSLRIVMLCKSSMYVGGLACPTGLLRLKRYDHARFQLSQSNSETIGLNYDGCILYSLMFPVQ